MGLFFFFFFLPHTTESLVSQILQKKHDVNQWLSTSFLKTLKKSEATLSTAPTIQLKNWQNINTQLWSFSHLTVSFTKMNWTVQLEYFVASASAGTRSSRVSYLIASRKRQLEGGCSMIFLERMRQGHWQSDQRWNSRQHSGKLSEKQGWVR